MSRSSCTPYLHRRRVHPLWRGTSMRKIRLDIEELVVESFGTADGRDGKGTVRGHDLTQFIGCGGGGSEESNCATCLEGCPRDTMTCFASCRMTNGNQACIDPHC